MLCDIEDKDQVEDGDKEAAIRKRMLINKRLCAIKKDKTIPKRHYLMTSRFNNKSFSEMREYCRDSKSAKVVYGSPKEISMYVPREAIMFILEMNNDANRIMGVGLVKNNPYPNKHVIYEDGNWNRHNFVGKHRIDRDELTEDEEWIFKALDIICFTGCRHQKRNQGITIFPPDMIERCKKRLDLVLFVANMFKARM
jgi:hypothetical protein